MDDVSLAHALAERYKKQGLNPNSAYSQDDDMDFAQEFGLNN